MVDPQPDNSPGPERSAPHREPAENFLRDVQAASDRVTRAVSSGDLGSVDGVAAALLRELGLYSGSVYVRPSEGIAEYLSPKLQPFVGRLLAFEALTKLGQGDRLEAFTLAHDATIAAPKSGDVLSVLRMIARDNAARGGLDDAEAFLQLDAAASAHLMHLAAEYEILDGHAPLGLVACRERRRLKAQRDIETMVRDHLAAAEKLPADSAVRRALCERGARWGLAGLPLFGLPDMMAGLHDLQRRDSPLALEPGTLAARRTAGLLEAVGIAYRAADREIFAYVVLSLACRLDPKRSAAATVLKAITAEFQAESSEGSGGAGSDARDVELDAVRWAEYRKREIPLGWNFSHRGNELFADAFYKARFLEGFSVDFAREAAHDFSLIDREGADAAELFVRAVPKILLDARDESAPPAERLAQIVRAQHLLRYIETRSDISREILKPAHRFAGDVEKIAAALGEQLPDGALRIANSFVRIIRTHHSD